MGPQDISSELALSNPSNEDERHSGELIYGLQRFREDFKGIRKRIEGMSDDALIALYEEAKLIGQVSWVVRCIILGTAHGRSSRGDGTVKDLAKSFGIGIRMAEIDIRVYDTFIKNDPDFECILPAHFYQIASRCENPKEAIEYAIEQRYGGKFTASDFKRTLGGTTAESPAPSGFYELVAVERAPDESERTKLSGSVSIFTVNGQVFAEIK
jgi:hypothetical protein